MSEYARALAFISHVDKDLERMVFRLQERVKKTPDDIDIKLCLQDCELLQDRCRTTAMACLKDIGEKP